jgi:hypothetical protein
MLSRAALAVLAVLAAQVFAATNPPVLLSVEPQTSIAGTPGFVLTVKGANFVTGAQVRLNGVPRQTTFVSSGEINTQINNSDLVSPKTIQVTATVPGSLPSSPLTFEILPNAPTITAVDPKSVLVDATARTITVDGQNFDRTAAVRVGTAARETQFVDATRLTFDLTPADVSHAGTLSINVLNPNNKVSNPFSITVANGTPSPTISLLEPSSVPAGKGNFDLTIGGSNFVRGAQVKLNGGTRITTFTDSTRLVAAIVANDVAKAGSATITVTNPDGTVSAAATLKITAGPVPTITAISPNTVTVGSQQFTLSIVGTNFVNGTTVKIGGSAPRLATFVDPQHLTIGILSSEVRTSGAIPITVTTPGTTGSTSNSISLFVVAENGPKPTSLSPATVLTGSPSFRLLVTGTAFQLDDVVQLDGVDNATEFISSTQLATTVAAAEIAAARIIHVTVRRFNNTATSAPLDLTVTAAELPAIVTLAPSSANVGDPSLAMLVTGRNFTPQSIVTFDNAPLATTYISATELRAVIPASQLETTRTVPVTVVNSSSAVSNSVLFTVRLVVPEITVLSPASVISGEPAFQLVVTGKNFSATSVININGLARPTQLQASTGALTTNIAADEVAAFGTLDVTVSDKGATSDVTSLLVRRPEITEVFPGSIIIGDPPATLEVRGNAFLSTSKIVFHGVELPTTFGSGGILVGKLDPTTLLEPGEFSVSVRNSAASISKPFFITITATAAPHIDSVTPSSIAFQSPATQLKIIGSNFVILSQVKVNGKVFNATFASVNELRITLQSEDLATSGALRIVVTTPSGGSSNEFIVTVNGPPPPPGSRTRPVRH